MKRNDPILRSGLTIQKVSEIKCLADPYHCSTVNIKQILNLIDDLLCSYPH